SPAALLRLLALRAADLLDHRIDDDPEKQADDEAPDGAADERADARLPDDPPPLQRPGPQRQSEVASRPQTQPPPGEQPDAHDRRRVAPQVRDQVAGVLDRVVIPHGGSLPVLVALLDRLLRIVSVGAGVSAAAPPTSAASPPRPPRASPICRDPP